VYSRVGGGHLSAARALASELEATGRVTTRLVDVYVECGRFPLTHFPSLYARMVRRYPRLWSMIYRGSNTHLDPKRILGPFLNGGLRRLVARERPAAVVSVLPAVNGLLAESLAECRAHLEVVVTDWHAVHRFWVAPGVAQYTVATDSARAECIRFGAPPESIEVMGIPVRRDFTDAQPAPTLRQAQDERLGLAGDQARADPRPFTILAMVGAEGSPSALENIAHLALLDLDAELVVVCGHDRELRQRMQQLPTRMPLRALGFVDNVAELIRGADILVTKAGGLTLAEAFCCGVPVVVHDLLPGQEAGNLEYALGQDAVAYAPDAGALAQTIVDLYHEPKRRAALSERGRRLARPDAAQRIARNILSRLDGER
jgi:UDP-N-acetylglucosamine:LPS N-acetylglucosamine transferase